MIVVSRFRVDQSDAEVFRVELQAALEALAGQRGHLHGAIGCNVDDPTLWVLSTEWKDVGSYRRALSSYDVKVTAVPVLSRAIDEPSAYERVVPGATLNEQRSRSIG
ncbi:antibiotic biosynthesis monooxygenase family protein [Nocardioides houyundeii]|uniref:antibiotic biosynthesis monooxygenase family protein n=1 Tax=Nocardioides houyundeii TaxID=2045452 RepID=UPI000DF18CB8|nr:antibiotic biosynthesis monooxygenase family protein [Nocardioides houyundeii]